MWKGCREIKGFWCVSDIRTSCACHTFNPLPPSTDKKNIKRKDKSSKKHSSSQRSPERSRPSSLDVDTIMLTQLCWPLCLEGTFIFQRESVSPLLLPRNGLNHYLSSRVSSFLDGATKSGFGTCPCDWYRGLEGVIGESEKVERRVGWVNQLSKGYFGGNLLFRGKGLVISLWLP